MVSDLAAAIETPTTHERQVRGQRPRRPLLVFDRDHHGNVEDTPRFSCYKGVVPYSTHVLDLWEWTLLP
jgi:hypothetical protein